MSYKSLLFCPDERTAPLVTQVLSDLEFAVEVANDVSSAVTMLTDEHFDALVVDCQNEQNASSLFNAARNSAHNHSSLSVAVVEGQAGVAKAFRIGANLVLTKPINLEQSKGTLRVARGLLRKNEAKPTSAAGVSPAKRPSTSTAVAAKPAREVVPHIPAPSVPNPAANHASAAPAIAASTAPSQPPSTLFEVEQDALPAPAASEAALLDSMPQLPIETKASEEPKALHDVLPTKPEPMAASSSRFATAAAPALEKSQPALSVEPSGRPPMLTNEPITATTRIPEAATRMPVEAPTFAALNTESSTGGAAKFLKIAVVLVVVGMGAYFGWQKFHSLHFSRTAQVAPAATAPEDTPPPAPATLPAQPSAATEASHEAESPAAAKTFITPDSGSKAEDQSNSDDIEVEELPLSRDARTGPKPLMVKSDAGKSKSAKREQAAAPSLDLSAVDNSAPALPGLTSTAVPLPTLAPSSVHVSQGVSQGLILKKVPPVYPPMALQLHKEGAVELLATISKKGDITSVKVLSGDAMLARAAQDAVRQWKYRPYLLDGQPVEIQTQITIKFKTPR